MEKILKLFDLYAGSNMNINSDDNILMEYDSREYDLYEFDISLNKQDKEQIICLFIEKENNLMFKGIINRSTNGLNVEYNNIKDDLLNLKMEEFIDKYYEILIEKNFR